jgi:hypothetical protein
VSARVGPHTPRAHASIRGMRPNAGPLPSRPAYAAFGMLCAAAACACDPTVIIGTRVCQQAPDDAGPGQSGDGSVPLPWSTGFENGFCDYAPPVGFCYEGGGGSYSLVTSPVHSGRYAAAFSVNAAIDGGSQARCVLQGVFPTAAYYSAWYYVPAPAVVVNGGNWNLFHFQGGSDLHGLWDMSLSSPNDGGLYAFVRDYVTFAASNSTAAPPIPIGRWFHFEVYVKRANDATGEISLLQDGVPAGQLTGLATDNTDVGQWYVGNLTSTNAIMPPVSTVYVDDVTITTM